MKRTLKFFLVVALAASAIAVTGCSKCVCSPCKCDPCACPMVTAPKSADAGKPAACAPACECNKGKAVAE